MKKTLLIITIIIVLVFLYIFIKNVPITPDLIFRQNIFIKEKVTTLSASEKITSFNEPFTVGERFHYIIAWQGIPVGEATATIESLINFNNYEVYKIVVKAQTNDFLSKLFKIDDTFISYMDRNRLISRHYEAIIREGKYKKDLVVDYDFENLTATYTNLQDGSVKQCQIEKDVQDPVSAAYYFRTIPMDEGKEIELVVNHSEKNFKIYGDVEGKTEFDAQNIGTFEAFLIKPYLKTGDKKLRHTNIWGYLSADEKKLILYVNIKALEIPWLGEVTATLDRIEYISPTEN
jgi:hypothetical protein